MAFTQDGMINSSVSPVSVPFTWYSSASLRLSWLLYSRGGARDEGRGAAEDEDDEEDDEEEDEEEDEGERRGPFSDPER
jgi:hypothetical protein